VRKADNLPPSSAEVTESGSLNLSELSGPHRPVMGMLYLFLLLILPSMLNIMTFQPDKNYPDPVWKTKIYCYVLNKPQADAFPSQKARHSYFDVKL
jgi:hypothetical protein